MVNTMSTNDLEQSLLKQKKRIVIDLNKKLDEVIKFTQKLKSDISQNNEVIQDTAIQFAFVFLECHRESMDKMIKHVENYRAINK